MSEKDDLIFIRHMRDSVRAIEEFSADLTKETLLSDRLRQSAIVREIEVIGEAARNVSDTLKKRHAAIPWKDIIGTRDIMIHRYFGVDLDIVWNIIKSDLPFLKKEIENILKQD